MKTSLIVSLERMGLSISEEVSYSFKEISYSTDYNPIKAFEKQINERLKFIKSLQKLALLPKDLSTKNTVEIGGGICSTGAAFAKECNTVISFELEKTHCIYAKKCKEFNEIDNLGIYMGSISNIDGHKTYYINNNEVDIVISYLGMFRDTIMPSLPSIRKMMKSNGLLIFVYPRFWVNNDKLNSVDKKLLKRATAKNSKWTNFSESFENELVKQGFIINYSGVLDNYSELPIGGDVILGSNIASSKKEYFNNPISDIKFGHTLITCNTLICKLP